MKILYYSSNPNLGLNAQTGYGTHMREMIDSWIRSGVEVKTLIAGDQKKIGTQEGSDLNAGRLKSSLKSIIPSFIWESFRDYSLIKFDSELGSKLEDLIRDFQPDCIYERISYLQTSGVDVAKKMNIKHVSEINAPFPEERRYFSGNSYFINRAKKAEERILKNSSQIAVVSSALKAYLAEENEELLTKIHVIPNAVNTNNLVVDESKQKFITSSLNLGNEIIIGFVGSVFPYHGVEILIRAFSQVERKNLKLLIVGDGESIPDLKKMVIDLGIQSKVIFTGSVKHSEVPTYISLMDICCMMDSNWYGSPVKIFEYGGMGKAVIAPDLSPVRDVMTNLQDGLLIKKGADYASDALSKLVSNEELRIKLANNWRAKVHSKHTWLEVSKISLDLCK